MNSTPHIYLLPGMSYRYPVFSRLIPLLDGAKVLPYIDPQVDESLASYAKRISENLRSDSYLVGVSFGGMLAQEMSRVLNPLGCILISTIQRATEFPSWVQFFRSIGARNSERCLSVLGKFSRMTPRSIRCKSSVRINRYQSSDVEWHRWATQSILTWNPVPIDTPVLRVHGDSDATFPIRNFCPDVVISNGRHALPVSHPVEVANAIGRFVESKS